MIKFIEGNWYKGSENNYYIKFSHIDERNGYNRIYYTEKCNTNSGSMKHTVINDYWASVPLENFALNNPVTLDELKKILPSDHPDLNKSMFYEIY